MEIFADLLLFAWAPFVVLLFWSTRGHRRAVIIAYLAGLLLLPRISYKLLPGVPVIEKITVTNLGVLLSVLLFDFARLRRFRPRWIDLPAVVFWFSPFASSISNDLGAYDGLSTCMNSVTIWAIPYLVGRLYFSDLQGLRELAIGTLVSGAIYLPPILLESRLAPQLHFWIFGTPGRVSWETVDFMGPLRWKPGVFMDSALALSMFMVSAALCGYGLWRQGGLRRVGGIRVGWWLAAAMVGALLGKTLGGITLLLAGVLSLWLVRRMRTVLPLIALLSVSPLYMVTRASGAWSGKQATWFIAEELSKRRAESLETRFINEDMLVEKALRRPLLGWGGWGRARVYDAETEKDISLTDGFWVIVLGNQGLLGLISFALMLLLPPLLLLWKLPVPVWRHRDFAPVTVFTALVLLHAIDDLANAMFNPVFVLASGGLAGLATVRWGIRRRVAPLLTAVPARSTLELAYSAAPRPSDK